MINTQKVVISNILRYARFSNDNMIYKLSTFGCHEGANKFKRTNEIIFKKGNGSFLGPFHFFIWRNL